ncbi:MAG: argininosuccinate lyase [Candidatus Omnitrophota bacterium]
MSTLWGGRFSQKMNEKVADFSRSIHFDFLLAEYDCLGSLKHIDVLKKAKLISSAEHKKLAGGLKRILKQVRDGVFQPDKRFEDIHSCIQYRLERDPRVGKTAHKLHTCRSRNDQVLFDTKLYCLVNILFTERLLTGLIQVLRDLGEVNEDLVMPGFTHLQHAMPVAVKDVLDAYAVMLERDEIRLLNAYNGIDLTLGSGALAGTMIAAGHYNLPADADIPKKISPPDNPLATVADRDFIVEILSSLATVGMHLSRLCEDMILWSSTEFDFIEIGDAFCTGSSLMPQKKNPDVVELVRGYTGRLYGNLVNVLVMLKGLPMSYNRDMQHDKEPLFDSFAVVQESLDVLTAMMGQVRFKKDSLASRLEDESLYATDLADHLVKEGVAFKDAHDIIGRLVQYKASSGKDMIAMSAAELKKIHPALTPAVVRRTIDSRRSVRAKRSVRKR